MALTRTITHTNLATAVAATSTTVTLSTSSVLLVFMAFEHGALAGSDAATPMTNSGAALTWTKLADSTPVVDGTSGNECRLVAYGAIGDATSGSRTVTHTKANATAINRRQTAVVLEGCKNTIATAFPSGNRFANGTPTATVTQSITPAGVGSMLFCVAGDWADANAYVALANCTKSDQRVAGAYTTTLIEPTVQPLASGSAFTLGATCVAGSNTWVMVEAVPISAGGAAKSMPPFGMQRKFFTRRINR